MGIPEEKLRAVGAYRDGELFTPLERRVLDFASALSRSPVEVHPGLREELRRELGDAGVVQLAAVVAVENLVGRFNRGVGIASQGYDGGNSPRPPPAGPQETRAVGRNLRP